jgi:hypothetical protein
MLYRYRCLYEKNLEQALAYFNILEQRSSEEKPDMGSSKKNRCLLTILKGHSDEKSLSSEHNKGEGGLRPQIRNADLIHIFLIIYQNDRIFEKFIFAIPIL